MSCDAELGYVYAPTSTPDRRLVRRPSSRRRLVRREPGRARRQDRQARLALPGGAPRALGLRLPGGADPGRRDCRRQAGEGDSAGLEAGVRLRVRSRERQAGVADRGAAGAAVGRARRAVVADAAVPDQAAGVRHPGPDARRPDRPHAGAARRGAGDPREAEQRPLFLPPRLLEGNADGKVGAVQMPGPVGGSDWNGAAVDPETGILYVPSVSAPLVAAVGPPPSRGDVRYMVRGGGFLDGPRGEAKAARRERAAAHHPSALGAGDRHRSQSWRDPVDRRQRRRPARPSRSRRARLAAARPARPRLAAPHQDAALPARRVEGHDRGPKRRWRPVFRAFDKTTGDVLWKIELSAGATGAPMTYRRRQAVRRAAGRRAGARG